MGTLSPIKYHHEITNERNRVLGSRVANTTIELPAQKGLSHARLAYGGTAFGTDLQSATGNTRPTLHSALRAVYHSLSWLQEKASEIEHREKTCYQAQAWARKIFGGSYHRLSHGAQGGCGLTTSHCVCRVSKGSKRPSRSL